MGLRPRSPHLHQKNVGTRPEARPSLLPDHHLPGTAQSLLGNRRRFLPRHVTGRQFARFHLEVDNGLTGSGRLQRYDLAQSRPGSDG
jgi:hypothetical protein